MKQSSIFVVIVCGLVFGWFSPEATKPPASAPSTVAASETAKPDHASKDRAMYFGGEMALPRHSDGHFYADVAIGGAMSRMLVDTGASVVALTGDDADSMGVRWEPSEVEPVARGANGTVYGVRVLLDRIELGDFEANQVEAIVVPEGLDVSLLGQTFLSRIPKVAIEQDRMILGT